MVQPVTHQRIRSRIRFFLYPHSQDSMRSALHRQEFQHFVFRLYMRYQYSNRDNHRMLPYWNRSEPER